MYTPSSRIRTALSRSVVSVFRGAPIDLPSQPIRAQIVGSRSRSALKREIRLTPRAAGFGTRNSVPPLSQSTHSRTAPRHMAKEPLRTRRRSVNIGRTRPPDPGTYALRLSHISARRDQMQNPIHSPQLL